MSRSGSESPKPKGPTSLLVRNLDFHTKADELKEHFSKYGEVRDVYLPRDYHTQRPRGFGFIEFQNFSEAKEALEQLDGSEIMGSVVKIVFAREGRKNVTFR